MDSKIQWINRQRTWTTHRLQISSFSRISHTSIEPEWSHTANIVPKGVMSIMRTAPNSGWQVCAFRWSDDRISHNRYVLSWPAYMSFPMTDNSLIPLQKGAGMNLSPPPSCPKSIHSVLWESVYQRWKWWISYTTARSTKSRILMLPRTPPTAR